MIGCVIMAGGKSSRMNGIDKALMEINEKTLLSIAINKATQQTKYIVLNSNRDPSIFKNYNIKVIKDTISNHPGPLAGVLSGIEWFYKNNKKIKWVVSLPVDSPFFPNDLIKKLYETVVKSKKLIGVSSSNGRKHPVFSIWHISLMQPLQEALNNNIRKIDLFTKSYNPATVDFSSSVDPFYNINTPKDLNNANKLFTKGQK